MARYQLTGSVINGTTQQGIAALRIEAWGKLDKARKKLATTTTDDAGRFRIQFDVKISENNPNPQGVLKVFSGKKLLHTTAEHPIRQWMAQADPVTITVNQPAPPMDRLRIYVALSYIGGQAAAGVQLVFSYASPSGEP